MKKEIRKGEKWAKVRKKRHLTDVLYGYRDGTNNHGHTVISGMNVGKGEIIFERTLSGMILTQSGANLCLNNQVI